MNIEDILIGQAIWTWDDRTLALYPGKVVGVRRSRAEVCVRRSDDEVADRQAREVCATERDARAVLADWCRFNAVMYGDLANKFRGRLRELDPQPDHVVPAHLDPEAIQFDAPTIDETPTVAGWVGPVVAKAMREEFAAHPEPATDDLTPVLGGEAGGA